MGNVIKGEELGSYRRTLQTLKSRLRGDLSQMTDEALRLDNDGGTGNLSNVPLHMADLGTDNYDQEFTLELIENEQVTLDLVNEALGRMDQGTYGQCVECGDPITQAAAASDPVCTSLYPLCKEAGGWRMKGEGGVGLGRWVLFWTIALGGTAFDLLTKAIIFERVGPPPAPSVPIVPHILELHTSQNTGALWGFGSGLPHSSEVFAGLSVIAAILICYWLFFMGAASSAVLTVALALIMAGRWATATTAWLMDTSGISSIFTSMRSASIGPSSTSPTTCWSPGRPRWCSMPCVRRHPILSRLHSRHSRAQESPPSQPSGHILPERPALIRRNRAKTRTDAAVPGSSRLRASACTRSRYR